MKDGNKIEKHIVNIFIKVCSLLVAIMGILAIVGWILDIPQLASFDPCLIPMALSTAVLFVTFGLIIFFHNQLPSSRIMFRVELVISSIGILVALLVLYFSLNGIRPDIEHLGMKMNGVFDKSVAGHMSPVTAFCFILVSLSFLIIRAKPGQKKQIKISLILAAIVFVISIIILLSYLLGTPLLYEGSFIPPALTTYIAFLFLVTALLLISALKIWSQEERSDVLSTRYTYILVLVFTIITVSIMTVGYSYYKSYEKQYLSGIKYQLSSIALLKVNQIVKWRKERLEDAEILLENAEFSGLVKRYTNNQNDIDAKKRIEAWIEEIRSASQYNRICLHDTNGVELISSPDEKSPKPFIFSLRSSVALKSGQIYFQDFYRDINDNNIYLTIFIPILSEQSAKNIIGVLALRIDPKQYLYPLINEWPTQSKTAETLLIRREGNNALFLNELKFQKNTALNLRRPLTEINLPAAQAALGKKEFMEGVDYRGAPVIAYVCPIPNSPWYLVARIDISEIYAPLREWFWAIVILVIGLLIGSGASIGLIWRQQRSKFYQERYQSTENIKKLNRVYAVLSEINEAIVRIRNPQELFKKACDIAVEKGGFQMAWIGKINLQTTKVDIVASKGVSEEYFKIINSICESDESLFGIAGRVIKTGVHIISNDIQKDDSILPKHKESVKYGSKSFAAFPIKNMGQVWGIFKLYSDEIGYFDKEELKLLDELAMDISFAIEFDGKEDERKRTEEALQESEKRYRQVIQSASDIIFTTDINGNILFGNNASLSITGYSVEEFTKMNYMQLTLPEYKRKLQIFYMRQFENKLPTSYMEYPLKNKLGDTIWLGQNANLIFENDQIKGFHLLARDITVRKRMEEALRESEERFRMVFENVFDGIGIYSEDPDPTKRKLIECNEQYAAMAGRSRDEMLKLGTTLGMQITHGYNANAIRLKSLEKGIAYQGSFSWIRPDGKENIIEYVGMPVKWRGKSYTIGIDRDITERNRIEEALTYERYLLKELLDNSFDNIYFKDIESRFIRVSKSMAKTFGLSDSAQVIGKTDFDFFNEEHARPAYEAEMEIIKTGLPIVGLEEKETWPDGKVTWVSTTKVPLRDIKGEIIGTFGISRDITEHKQAEESLIKLSSAIEQTIDSIIITDRNGIIEYVNHAFEDLTGYSSEEAVGKTPRILKSGTIDQKYYEEMWKQILSGKVLKAEVVNKKKNGTLYDEEKTISPIFDKNKNITHFVGTGLDITERKLAEKELIDAKERAEESDKLKTEFLAQMSHEIRTPINIMIGNVDYLNQSFGENMDSEARDCFDGIDLASKRIIRTVDLILNTAELQASSYKPQFVKIDLNSKILKKLYQEHQLSAKQNGIEIIYTYKENDTDIIADEYSITQIFANLIDNAIKYTKKGKVEILLTKNKTGNIMVEVKDTGIGISKKHLPRIFEPFTQEEQGYSRSFEGNGLGLALVKRYCELNNIIIEVESEKNVGSTFRIIFGKKITEIQT
jgi:PAS domain S-box-containing protein